MNSNPIYQPLWCITPHPPSPPGLLGSVVSVPAGYSISFALSFNNTGVNNALTGVGSRLLTV